MCSCLFMWVQEWGIAWRTCCVVMDTYLHVYTYLPCWVQWLSIIYVDSYYSHCIQNAPVVKRPQQDDVLYWYSSVYHLITVAGSNPGQHDKRTILVSYMVCRRIKGYKCVSRPTHTATTSLQPCITALRLWACCTPGTWALRKLH